jgi:hypothetical protein
MTRNTQKIGGGLVRAQREALAGDCQVRSCTNPAQGFIQLLSNPAFGICGYHAAAASRDGYTIYGEPFEKGH